MSGGSYKCEHCGGTFPYDPEWSDEDAMDERATNGWGHVPDEDMAIVCDDCYKKMMAPRN